MFRLHRQCERDATLSVYCDPKNWQSQRGCKGRNKVSDGSRNQIGRELSFEQKTGRDWFGRSDVLLVSETSQRGLLSSQTGCRLCGDRFRLGKGGDSLQPSDDLSVTDQRWVGDPSLLHRRPFAVRFTKWFPSVRWSIADGFAKVTTCLRIQHHLSHVFTEFASIIFYCLLYYHPLWPVEASRINHRITFEMLFCCYCNFKIESDP